MSAGLRWTVVVIVMITMIVATFAIASMNWSNFNAKGVLRDYLSHEPIAGARLVMECKDQGWERTILVRRIETVSAQDGTYGFDFAKTWDCDYALLSAEKTGYKDTGELNVPYVSGAAGTQVPRYAYMVKDSDVAQLRLDKWLQSSNEVRSQPKTVYDYSGVFVSFRESTQVAVTPEQVEFVRLHYCDRLLTLYAKVPEVDRAIIREPYYNQDYETQVRPYCQAPTEATSSPAAIAPG